MLSYHHGLKNKHGIPVLSVAVYLGVGLEGRGMDRATETFGDLEIGATCWPYLGLPALEAREYVAGPNILGAALSVRMRIDDNDKAWLKATAMQRVATAALTDHRRFLLMEFIEAYLPLEEPHLSGFQRFLVTVAYKEASMLGKSSRDLEIEEGKRLILRQQLEERFGKIDAEAIRRLEAMEEADSRKRSQGILANKALAELGLAGAP